MSDLLPIPVTGEALDLSAPNIDLAEAFDRIRDMERQLKEARDLIGAELTRRMDASAKWSWEEHGYKVSVPSPAPKTEWDVAALRVALDDLLGADLIDERAVDAALAMEVTFKPRAAGLHALLKLGGLVAERLGECRSEVDPVRRVSVRPVA